MALGTIDEDSSISATSVDSGHDVRIVEGFDHGRGGTRSASGRVIVLALAAR